MPKRAGTTEKISVSLNRADLASLKKRAKRLYGGNLSAVIAEFAADAKLLESMHELVNWLGGPLLTDDDRRNLDRELAPRRASRPKSRPKKAA